MKVKFNVGDFVFHQNEGILKVTEVSVLTFFDITNEYYVLKSHFVDSSLVIRIPTNNCAQIREPFSKEELDKMLKKAEKVESVWDNDSRKRKETYQRLMNDNNPLSLLTIVKTINSKKREYVEIKKVLPLTDQTTLNLAKKLLCEEFALAYNCDTNYIVETIIDKF